MLETLENTSQSTKQYMEAAVYSTENNVEENQVSILLSISETLPFW